LGPNLCYFKENHEGFPDMVWGKGRGLKVKKDLLLSGRGVQPGLPEYMRKTERKKETRGKEVGGGKRGVKPCSISKVGEGAITRDVATKKAEGRCLNIFALGYIHGKSRVETKRGGVRGDGRRGL